MNFTKISKFMTIKKSRFWTKNNFGNITNLMIFDQKACSVDNENDPQIGSIATPPKKIEIFQILRFLTKKHGL